VCGRRNWGKLVKCTALVSQAKDKDGGPNRVVTKSDEAFALLIFENYVNKWKKQKAVPVDDANANNAGADERGRPQYRSNRGRQERTPDKRVGTASTVGGVMTEWYGSMNCTNWWRMTELASKQRQWRRNFENFAAVSTVETLEGIRKENRAITMRGLQ
jgi:hypothetical protein